MLNRALVFSAVLFLAAAIPVANSAPSAVPTGKTYVYSVATVTAPASVTINGLGATWLFSVIGGSASFTIANGSTITLTQAATIGGDFNYAVANPTLTLTGLTTGATVTMVIDGVN